VRRRREDSRGEQGEQEEREEGEEGERGSDEGFKRMTPLLQAHHAMEKMEEFVHKVGITHTHTHAQTRNRTRILLHSFFVSHSLFFYRSCSSSLSSTSLPLNLLHSPSCPSVFISTNHHQHALTV
jgi:hypothetical protein